jgi:hypothetical protein
MAPKKEFGPGVNDHEAGSSRQIVPTAFLMAPPVAEHEHIYITVVLAQTFWEAGAPMPWGDVHFPHGWHLSPNRVPVPPIPAIGRARLAEIYRRRVQLPPDLRLDLAYAEKSPYWDMWFEAEQDQRRTFFTSRAATARPRTTPRTPPASARRAPTANGGGRRSPSGRATPAGRGGGGGRPEATRRDVGIRRGERPRGAGQVVAPRRRRRPGGRTRTSTPGPSSPWRAGRRRYTWRCVRSGR